MKRRIVKKGTILQAKGDLNTKVYQVEQGLLRVYHLDDKGKEHIYMFCPESWHAADARPPEQPCMLFIDALEDSVVLEWDKNASLEVHDKLALAKRIVTLQDRVIRLMSATALERYQHFMEIYPDILQRVPQRMVASYLGVTPEALSKVKSQYYKSIVR